MLYSLQKLNPHTTEITTFKRNNPYEHNNWWQRCRGHNFWKRNNFRRITNISNIYLFEVILYFILQILKLLRPRRYIVIRTISIERWHISRSRQKSFSRAFQLSTTSAPSIVDTHCIQRRDLLFTTPL